MDNSGDGRGALTAAGLSCGSCGAPLGATAKFCSDCGTPVTHGTQSSLSSYSVAPSPYATLAVQQDNDKRAVTDIADRIRLDLGAFFRRRDGR